MQEQKFDHGTVSVLGGRVKGRPTTLLPRIDRRSVLKQQPCSLEVSCGSSRVQRHHLRRISRRKSGVRSGGQQNLRRPRLPEIAREMECGESIRGKGAHQGLVSDESLEQFGSTQGRRLENIEFLFFVRDALGQVASATIQRLHQQANSARIADVGQRTILIKKAPNSSLIPGLQKFETALRALHSPPQFVVY